ncbi:glycoside hydrolase family 16 protein [Gillisia limnaea]|uniref:Glycoside hydrolase family 16 n=1 Tax=Gillisia limnaea (strain DSM 15749 / LMG 21470 / R-8282) TaxID=865937 RepID=H2BW87_GILLR|nr:glycoside hydrolase family 16 protein [Gillisia limnaea]EHQ04051.1 glycoside hydrolase family 16 [Gillisia limnaea DSM 15749]
MNLFQIIIFLLIPAMLFSQKYELKWSEEFNGSQLNTEVWNFEKGFAKNNEAQFYTGRTKNARIEDGNLILEAYKEDYGNADYTSARINTLNKKHFRYGRIEVRAKLPEGQGTWPAIWMLGINHHIDGFPACGEIDIMEYVGKAPGEVHGTIHYPETDNIKMNSASQNFLLPPSKDGFHTYSIEWDGAQIDFFVDDIKYHHFEVDDANRWGRKNIFRKPFYLVLNLALGGKWAGEIDDTIFPARFYVDYVRFYQLKE